MNSEFKLTTRLNGICPYFTMFPLNFPYQVLNKLAKPGEWVADPFCGRGTTNYASRILGLPSIGIDSSPVAVAISEAKLANTSSQAILRSAERILDNVPEPNEVPTGEFWEWAFHKDVLHLLCRLKQGLQKDCRSHSRKALRAVILGALHGPQPKTKDSYFSNQSPRTYAPKPLYAVRYWKKHNLKPRSVDVLEIVRERAERYFSDEKTVATGTIFRADSRDEKTYRHVNAKLSWVITSPPYYGMRTYIPDQWLRMWFLGGQSEVDYSTDGQVKHSSPEEFASELSLVWKNVGKKCIPGARLVIRFGGINDRKADPFQILSSSLQNTGWEIQQIQSAGSAAAGYRQANHIRSSLKEAREEYDVWAVWQN